MGRNKVGNVRKQPVASARTMAMVDTDHGEEDGYVEVGYMETVSQVDNRCGTKLGDGDGAFAQVRGLVVVGHTDEVVREGGVIGETEAVWKHVHRRQSQDRTCRRQ